MRFFDVNFEGTTLRQVPDPDRRVVIPSLELITAEFTAVEARPRHHR